MSYIRSTLKCSCGKFTNVATGSFGSGVPDNCSFCGKPAKFETVADGWYADKNGDWDTSFEEELTHPNKESL